MKYLQIVKKICVISPKVTLLKFLMKIFKITTTKDNGELHPWSTGLHRGVPNYKHNIRFINQDLVLANKKYPPFWIDLGLARIDVGILVHYNHFLCLWKKL